MSRDGLRRAGLAAVLVTAVVVQLSWLAALRPLGVVPDLVLVVVVLIALEGTASTALLAGLGGGLAMDLASGANFGLFTGIMVLAALAGGLVHRAGIELDGPLVALVMVVAGTLLLTVSILLGVAGAVSHWPLGSILGRFTVELVINLMLTLGLRPVVRALVPGGDPGVTVIG